MKRGLSPIRFKDSRTYDFHKTFGTVSLPVPIEFTFDQAPFPDQNADGFPQACTAYATTGMASNSDKTNYDDKAFTYDKTKLMMGVEGDVPCDQMTALKSATVYGVRQKGQSDQVALNGRQAPYFIVKKLNGSYFDGLVSAMIQKQGTLSIGTWWSPVFESPNADGTIADFIAPSSWNEGHNWEAVGVKIVAGEPRIICKSWQGPAFGDHGYLYFSRKQTDALLGMKGSGAFGQKHATPEEIKQVEMNIIEVIISYLWQIIAKL